jgi:hypothetical protein
MFGNPVYYPWLHVSALGIHCFPLTLDNPTGAEEFIHGLPWLLRTARILRIADFPTDIFPITFTLFLVFAPLLYLLSTLFISCVCA